MSKTPPLEQLTESTVVIVAGKGGVGKTTVTAVLARAAANRGQRVLAIELDGKPTLSALLADHVDVLSLDPGEALRSYLLDHGFGKAAKRFINSGALDVVSTATPGLREVVTLGKIKQLERSGDYDLIVVDGPAAGHAITFLTSASGLLDAVRSGPIHRQASEVNELLGDPARCSTVLVTLAETTPVNELIETAFKVEERAGVHLTAVVANQIEPVVTLDGWDELALPEQPALQRSIEFSQRRWAVQASAMERLDAELPLPRIELPALPVAGLSASDIGVLADAAFALTSTGTSPTIAPVDDGAPPSAPNLNTEINPLPKMMSDARVVVCCGSGGVGKTTVAATLGIEAAQRGRRAVVVTIDPARRLADALGLPDGLSGDPERVPLVADAGGELWAMMLDTAKMLERVVAEHASDAEQARRIADNRFFVNMSQNLSGTQEYMASEALYQLHNDDRFDLVIVDTPPSRNALDFLESPGVLARFLQHPIFKLMMMPTRTGLKLVGGASQLVFKRIGRIIGSDVLADTAAFFQAFAGMESGFQERAEAVSGLMSAPETHFVLVGAPQADTLAEAAWFADQLRTSGYGVTATVINRLAPSFVDGEVPTIKHPAVENLARLEHLAASQRHALSRLVDRLPHDTLVSVPLLPTDVHDVEALEIMRDHLMRLR